MFIKKYNYNKHIHSKKSYNKDHKENKNASKPYHPSSSWVSASSELPPPSSHGAHALIAEISSPTPLP